MSKEPIITINMIVRNEEKHMSSALQSLLSQTYSNFILVIADNGSTDSTGEIADSFAKQDPRVTVLHVEQNDPAILFKMFDRTQTPYYMFAAGHDFYAPKFVEKCLAALEADPQVVLAYPRAAWFKDDKIIGEIPGIFDTRGMDIFSRAMVVAYGLIEAYQFYGIYRLAPLKSLGRHHVIGSDHVLLTELATVGSFALIDECLFFLRRAEDWGDTMVYRKKHLPNEPDGVGPFLRMVNAYMSIADNIADPTDKDLFKMAFFTNCMLRYRGILGMFGESIESLLNRSVFKELSGLISDAVRFIEQDLQREYAGKVFNCGENSDAEQGTDATKQQKTHIRVAGDVATPQNLTAVDGESEFARAIAELFASVRPKKVIETGTYLGEGTTRIIASTLKSLGIKDSVFCTIECNPDNYRQAQANLTSRGLIGGVHMLHGISVPRNKLPTIKEIEEQCVNNIEYNDIFVDHQEMERAYLYYKETDFTGIPDDLLGQCLRSFNYRPDFVLLDSGGHMGNIEFNYLISQLQGPCYIALDDIYHIKHHKSFRQIQADPRFDMITTSREKFGFCIARVTPASEFVADIKRILWLRTDSIGDNVLASSMLPHIHDHYKDASITVVCQKRVSELYKACPYVDRIITFNRKRALSDEGYRIEIIRSIKELNADILMNSVYSREPLTDLFSFESGAKECVALEGDLSNMTAEERKRNNKLYTAVIKSEGKFEIELDRSFDFLKGIGINVSKLEPVMWLTPEDDEFAEKFFKDNNLDTSRTIALFAGAQCDVRIYQGYGTALAEICREYGLSVIALGDTNDFNINRQNLDATGARTINLSGMTALRQTAAILKRCRLAVGAETGVAHIACAAGVPNVILLGGGHFGRFMPYSPLTSIVTLPLECFACNWQCKYSRVHCIKDISPEVLAEAVRQTLEKTNEKPRIFVQGISLWEHKPEQPRWQFFHNVLNVADVEIIPVGDIPSFTAGIWEKLRSMDRTAQVHFLKEAADEFVRDGGKLFSYNDFEGAELSFSRALELQNNSPKALNNLGVLYYKTGDKERALKHLEAAVRIQPGNATFLKNLADLYHVEMGRVGDAVEIYTRILKDHPDDTETLIALGNMSITLNVPREARAFFERAVALDPKNVHARRGLEILKGVSPESVEDTCKNKVYPKGKIAHERLEGLKEREQACMTTSDGHPLPRVAPFNNPSMDKHLPPACAESPSERTHLVSAIVSTYNAERFIEGCLQDLIDQTLFKKGMLEIVIVNSGSEQNEDAIISVFRDKYPEHIVYLKTEEREPIYQAWNRGIKAASGKYITNANSDDRHRADALEILANELDAHPDAALVYGNQYVTKTPNESFEHHTRAGEFRWPAFDRIQLIHTSCCGPQPMWRKSAHEELGYFDETMKVAGDYDWWLRLSERHELRHVDETIGLYLLSESSIEHWEEQACVQETIALRTKYARQANLAKLDYQKYPSTFLHSIRLNEPPLVSVIVPTYNRPEMLAEALESILSQTYQDYEIIVVNDCGQEVEDVVNKLNTRENITYLRHDRNRGLAAARNTGIRLARGKYIAYLDDDDLYYPDHLETLVHFLESSDSKVAYTDAYRAYQMKENGRYRVVKRDVPFSRDFDAKEILVSNFIPVLCVMHEKSCLDEVGFLDETLSTHEDWDLWIRMSRKFKFHHIKKMTCEFTYRQDGTTMSGGKRDDFLKTLKVIYGKYQEYVKDRPDLMEAQKQFLQDLKDEIHGKMAFPCPAGEAVSISIIIPVYNHIDYTRQCLKAIEERTPATPYEIIIVDNGSSDGTEDFLRQEEEAGRLRAIFNKTNIGFARACNQGAEVASSEYLLFLNNDTEPKKGWLEPLIKIMERDRTVAGVGSKLLFPDGTIQHAGVVLVDHKKLNDPLWAEHIYLKASPDLPKANQLMSYQALTAACLLVRRSSFEEVGGFDEAYWNGYEDMDLCFKFQKKHWKLVYQPESVLVHHASQSGPERFAKVSENIKRLHKKWLGKIEPDLIIEKDGSVKVTDAGRIQPYSLIEERPSVSMIILTFNQLKYTKKCIESVRRHTPEPHEILFVDNGSKDGTVKWLRRLVQENPSYKLIENGKNLGFAKGCNQGIRAATGECILLLNNDVIVTEGWLDGMLRCLKSAPDVGIVGPMTNSISGPQRVPGADYGSTNRLEEYAHSFREKNRDRRIPVKRIVGFCMLFKRELTEKIGFLDEQFGSGNFEDDDFCLRASLEGYRNLIAGDVFIHHYGSRSFIGNKIDYTDALSRNRKIFQKKWQGIDAKGPLGMKLLTIHAMEKADELNQKDQVKEAVETLSKGIGYSPNERRLYEMLSELLIDAKQFQEALEVLNRMPSGDTDIWKLERAGYCKEGLERHEEAEEIADLVLSLHPNFPFAWNLKGMVAYKKEDKERAETLFKKAMALDPGYGEPYTNLGVLKWTLNEKGEALDLLERGFILSPTMTDGITTYHSAITATGEFERAERVFGEAKVLYPLNRRIAFLLIDVLIQQGKNDAAMSEIEEALIHFGIDDGILSAALEMRNRLGAKDIDPESKGTVSLCMIVRDEEENLPRSLMSVKPAVDEMIVVDTGSTDRTREIARVFGAKVYDYEWADDFSGARNFSLSKATGRWILIVDADEVISPIDHGRLAQIVKERSPQPVAYSLTTRNYVEPVNISGWTANDGRYNEEAGTGWFPGTKVRLFPNNPRIHFEHPVHELVEPSLRKAGIKVKECGVPIHHYGKLSMKRNQRKGEEYLLLGKKKLEERGGDFLSLYELAVQAGELGAFEEAVGLWQKCIELQPENSTAHFNLGYAYLKLGRYEEALSASARAMELAPDFKEAIFNYSLCEFCAGDIQKTISALESLIVKEPRYPSAMALLSAAYLIDGKRERGLETLGQMKSMGYDGPASLCSFAERLISASRMDAAVSLLERAIETENMNDQIVALLAQCKRTGEQGDQPCLRP